MRSALLSGTVASATNTNYFTSLIPTLRDGGCPNFIGPFGSSESKPPGRIIGIGRCA